MKFSNWLKESVEMVKEVEGGVAARPVRLFLIIPRDYVSEKEPGVEKIMALFDTDTDAETVNNFKKAASNIIKRANITTGVKFGKLKDFEEAVVLPITFDPSVAQLAKKVISPKEYDESDINDCFKYLFTTKQLKESDIYSGRVD